jgi:hypothetical protein
MELCMVPDLFLCLYREEGEPDVQCGCVMCELEECMPEPIQWYCATGAEQPGCPVDAPEFGQACDSEGLTCIYGSLQLQTLIRRECTNGMWLKKY